MKRILRMELESISEHSSDSDMHVQWVDKTWDSFFADDPMQRVVMTQFMKQATENKKTDGY